MHNYSSFILNRDHGHAFECHNVPRVTHVNTFELYDPTVKNFGLGFAGAKHCAIQEKKNITRTEFVAERFVGNNKLGFP